jgi:hypothetical protein
MVQAAVRGRLAGLASWHPDGTISAHPGSDSGPPPRSSPSLTAAPPAPPISARTVRALTDRNADICERNGWDDDLARCDRLLGRLALAAGDTVAAGRHLETAAACFRDGDFLTDLTTVLTDLADYSQATGDLDAADRHVTEAVAIAAPRGLVPAQSAALAARARIRADRVAATADSDLLFQGRDAADAAMRLATRHHLAWHELDALRAHALLDQAEHVDHGWAAQAEALHARLVPPDLDPDPLATVERLVAAQKAADAEASGD